MLITNIDGKPVRDVRAIKNSIGLVRLGQQLDMEIIRDGEKISISATIEELK